MFNAVLESPILSQLHRLCYKPRLPAIQRGACYPKGSDPLKKKHKDNQFAPENWGLPLPRFKRTNVPFQGPGHQSPRCSTAPLTCPPPPSPTAPRPVQANDDSGCNKQLSSETPGASFSFLPFRTYKFRPNSCPSCYSPPVLPTHPRGFVFNYLLFLSSIAYIKPLSPSPLFTVPPSGWLLNRLSLSLVAVLPHPTSSSTGIRTLFFTSCLTHPKSLPIWLLPWTP